MAEFNEQESEFSRLLQGMPCDDAPRPEAAARLREQALARFDQASATGATLPWWKHAYQKGKVVMSRPLPRLLTAAAACLMVVAGSLVLFGHPAPASSFDRFAEAIIAAKTARFQMEVTMPGQPAQKVQAWYLAPGKYRMEMGTTTNVSDFSTGTMVTLMPGQKQAIVMNIKNIDKGKLADNNYFDRLRDLLAKRGDAKDKQYVPLGEKMIDGKKVVGFQYDAQGCSVTLWGDPQTGNPVRIESGWSGVTKATVVMSNFDINVALDEKLFDLKPPADYKVQSLDVDGSEPREADLITAFRICTDLTGSYPETLDLAGVTKLMTESIMSKGKEFATDENIQGLMKEAIKIGRGFQFVVQLPESADATYAGKGVKRAAGTRPIFWYKPVGETKYHVIDADLSVVVKDKAPEVPGAVRIDKASPKNKSPK